MFFKDRFQAGRVLASKLQQFANRPALLVLALPRGGVPVGFEVARILQAPLDVFVVRKLGVPGHEELGMGAIAPGGTRVLNNGIIRALQIQDEQIEATAAREELEIQRREHEYRGGRPAPDLSGRTIILVDDGMATGSSMRVAAAALRQQNAAHLIVAVLVAAPFVCEELADEVEEVICAVTPEEFIAVGQWYWEFDPTTDEEVRDLLTVAAEQPWKQVA